MKKLLAAASAIVILSGAGMAQAAKIQAFDNGWYATEDLGVTAFHIPSNRNTYTTDNYRSFYAFDLSSLPFDAGVVTITFRGDNGYYDTVAATDTVELYDFTSSIDDLLSGAGDIGAYNDLGSGVLVGSATIATGGYNNMPQFTVSLSNAFVAQLNAAAASSDKRIVVGAKLADCCGDVLWSGSGFGDAPAAFLKVSGAAPEPAAWALMIAGLALTGATLRRRRAIA